MRTLDQEFAEAAYKKADEFGKAHAKGTSERKQYGGMAHKLPILIRTAGLAEALAFVESHGREGHMALMEDLGQVVYEMTMKDFAEQSRKAELQEYIHLTRRTMLALKWFKRFAQSVLDVDATQDQGVSQ